MAKYKTAEGWRYQAIRLGKPSVSLLIADSADKCKAACVEDAK